MHIAKQRKGSTHNLKSGFHLEVFIDVLCWQINGINSVCTQKQLKYSYQTWKMWMFLFVCILLALHVACFQTWPSHVIDNFLSSNRQTDSSVFSIFQVSSACICVASFWRRCVHFARRLCTLANDDPPHRSNLPLQCYSGTIVSAGRIIRHLRWLAVMLRFEWRHLWGLNESQIWANYAN